jgi:hypothetical protein
LPRFQLCKSNSREDPDVKGDLVRGRVVGGLSDVILVAGAVVREVGRAGNGFGGRVLFVREEGEAAASSFDIEREARDERADFRLEVDVGHSVGGFRFILRELALETIVLFEESLFAVPIDVRGFSISWDLVGIGVVAGGDGIFVPCIVLVPTLLAI